jgi:hypothetical protein
MVLVSPIDCFSKLIQVYARAYAARARLKHFSERHIIGQAWGTIIARCPREFLVDWRFCDSLLEHHGIPICIECVNCK